MPRFKFRMQKLLEYRHLQEKWAKDEYLARRAKRIEGEQQIELVKETRVEALKVRYQSLDERRAQEQYVSRLDEEQRAFESAVAVLAGEEESAKQEWIGRRQQAKAFDKLRDNALDEWQTEENRREQAELDDWSVMRRAA
ncbi:MAG: flagellar export protein FliJ [Armatimonadetes bacterium]|nr:flagellar export protein FliJ [Armatimonadota bacterium]